MTDSVASCHSDAGGVAAPAGTTVVALAGAPNVGKSTLFNRLTGARRDVGNWPGTTVEVGRGLMSYEGREFDVVDLPGAYSLDPQSPDEALTRSLLIDVPVDERPELVIVVGDAGRLARSLYLVHQLRETDQRLVLALTMGDVAARHGLHVDAAALSGILGVPVTLIDPRHRQGRKALVAAMDEALAADRPRPLPAPHTTDALAAADERFAWIDAAVSAAVRRDPDTRVRWSDRLDRVALSPVLGPALFLGAMWAVFQLTTTVAAPLQDALDWFFTGPVTTLAVSVLELLGLADTWIAWARGRRTDRRRGHAADVRAPDGPHVRPAGPAGGLRIPGARGRRHRSPDARDRPARPGLPAPDRRVRLQRARPSPRPASCRRPGTGS